MSQINHDYINSYLTDLIPKHEGILEDLEAYAKEHNTPIVTPDVAGLLKVMIKSTNSNSILEVGTAIGYSAILMGLSAGDNFKITTIEKNEENANIAIQNIKKAGMEQNINVLIGDASEVLDQVDGIYDIVFVDASKGHYMDFFEKSIGKLKIGGLFICDNVLFRGMVAERSLLIRRKITIVKRLKKFLHYISNNESLQTTIIPMGDGVSISCKLKEVVLDEKD
ncbi:MAG: O-methyltransferase [Clostridia bacterium]|jgi:predicted O-methyltransferase YrrM|nr:O-methyltransferase [Clostridia bacterium]